MIEALSKSKSKYLRSLRRRKMRYQHKSFVLEGEKICSELLAYFPESIEFLMASESLITTPKFNTVFLREKLILGSPADFKEHSGLDNPSAVMAVASMPEWNWPSSPTGKWVFLDGIQDPGNMGTIFRTLSWFGFEGLILGPGCVDPYNPKVIQSSMGGIFQLPHYQASIEEVLERFNKAELMALDLKGKALSKAVLPETAILVLGSEGKGLSEEVREKIQHWLHIPAAANAQMESLNAGVALGIAAAHWSQQNL